MKTKLTPIVMIAAAAVGCSDPTDITVPTGGDPNQDGVILRHTLTRGELTGMAYDPVADVIYVLEDVHSGDQTLHRFDYVSRDLLPVLTFDGEHDYGMRMIDGELWLAQSYDNAVARIANLDDSPSVIQRIEIASTPGLTEVNDVAVVAGDIFVVAGNMLTSTQHDGLQVITGPGYNSLTEIVSPGAAGWPNPGHGYRRAIVALDAGPTPYLAIATGWGGALEVRNMAGALVASEAGFGNTYLQRDSQNRLYTYGDGNVVRWSADLSSREEFPVNVGNPPLGAVRFVLRELETKIQFIYAIERREEIEMTAVGLPL